MSRTKCSVCRQRPIITHDETLWRAHLPDTTSSIIRWAATRARKFSKQSTKFAKKKGAKQ